MEEQQIKDNQRTIPQSDLDLNMLLTNTTWGRAEIPPGLKSQLSELTQYVDINGNVTDIKQKKLWDLLGFYTRDMRLANLTEKNGELFFVQYYIQLANDFLAQGLKKNFLTALSRAITILETSQSKGGFLRKRMNTFTQESQHLELEPPKKNLFGKIKTTNQ